MTFTQMGTPLRSVPTGEGNVKYIKKGIGMKKLCILLVLFLIQGCASRLELTNPQKTILTSLSESEANKIIEKAFLRTQYQSGLFSSNSSPFISNPKILEIKNGVVVFTDFEEHLSGVNVKPSIVPGSVEVTAKWDHTIEIFKLDFKKIKKIRIVSSSMFAEGYITSKNGTQFGLFGDNGVFVNIDVQKECADGIIAAVKFYSPSATIMSGVGL